ncbi:MAG: NAD-dependent epimerase/dehydratase family protein, partial [Gemmataceae bacterium]
NVGSRLAARLVERGDRVTVLDLRAEPLEDSPALRRCHLLTADIADPAALQTVFAGGSFDSVFHLAALLSADSERDAGRAWRVNLEGTRHILQAAAAQGVGRVIFTSSTASFGPGLPPPVWVDSPQWPASFYGATKVAGERLGVYFHHRFGLDFRGLRIPAVVAPRGAGGGATAFCSELFAHAVRVTDRNFYALTFHGVTLRTAGEVEAAREELLKSLEIHPSLGRTYWELGLLERDLGRFEESDAYTAAEKDVLRFTEQWTTEGRVAADVLDRLKVSLSPEHLVILAATAAQANLTSRFNNVFGVELP